MIGINKYIELIRKSFGGAERVYTCGSCVQFAHILQQLYGGIGLWSDKEAHAVLQLNGRYYDITGRLALAYVREGEFDTLITFDWDEETLWSKYFLQDAGVECPECNEIFLITQLVPELKETE